MAWLLRSQCWLIACILFTELVLPSVRGSEDAVLLILNTGTNLLPSPQFSSDALLEKRNLPTSALIIEASLPSSLSPPKPPLTAPTVENISHLLPPSHPPDQTPTKSERSAASSPVAEPQPPTTQEAPPLPEITHATPPSTSISSPPPTSETTTAASPSSSNSVAPSPPRQTTDATSPSISTFAPPPTPQTSNATSPSASVSLSPPSTPEQATNASSPSPSNLAAPPPPQNTNATSPSSSVSSAPPPTPQQATNVSSPSPSNFTAPPLPQTTNATSPSASNSSTPPPTPDQTTNVSSPSPSNLAAPPLPQNTNATSNGTMSSGPAMPPEVSTSPVVSGKNDTVPATAPSTQAFPPVHNSPVTGLVPVSSPKSSEFSISPTTTPAPVVPHSHSPKGLEVPGPVSAPPVSDHRSGDNRNTSSPPPSDQGHLHPPVSSPSGSLHGVPEAPLLSPIKAVPPPRSMPQSNHSLPPLPPSNSLPPSQTSIPDPNRSLPPSPDPVHQPKLPLPPSPAPVHQPRLSLPPLLAPVHQPMLSLPPSPAPMHKPKHSLSPSPALVPRPQHMLPPPPPNLDCTSLTCMDPLTNSPPGSPCGCVRPMKVGLRLSVALYTFFPLVSELAKEIASGTFMKQSQVRIMGANAATEQPDKSIVLVDLVPLGEKFDATTAYLTSEKFWHKQVGIKASYFGEYDVLYIVYPGLPPSPPMSPEGFDMDGGSNENNSRRIHPLGVDVRKRKERLGGSLIAIIVLSSVIALVLSVGAAWFFFLRPKDGGHLSGHTPRTPLPLFAKGSGGGPTAFGSCPSSASGSFSSSMVTYTGSAKTFTAAEVERATSNFVDSKIIGEGGFGRVYLGILDDETKVAVKVLKRDDQQGSREFLAEVEMLSRLHHRNLVKLIGICTEEHLRCLVYELIPNGSVESHLHGTDKEIAPLDWAARMKIALGSARGLAYLHEDSSPRVIHRDFKSSNILLECDFTPKVSDFGLARTALDEGNGHISTRVMGTFGYVAPEYAMTGHLLVKSDVYSYGVVLLEILTGRKPVDMLRPPGQENLVTWARPLLTSREGLDTILDPALGSSVPFDSVAKVAAIASMCVQPEVSHRPFMGEVVQALKLVCYENDEHRASESLSQCETTDQDPEIRISSGLVPEADKVLSASEIFSTSAKDVSGSFRRHSSSGPLSSSRSGQFWQRLRGFPRGSTSDYGPALKSRSGGRRWP